MKLFLFVGICSIFCTISLYSQVQIETRDGLMHYGFEIDQPDNQIVRIIDENNLEAKIPKIEIQSFKNLNSIIIYKGSKVIGHVSKVKDSVYYVNLKKEKKNYEFNKKDIGSIEILRNSTLEQYPFLGISALLPGGLNIVLGYMFGTLGTRLAAGTIPGSIFGVQGNLIYNLSKSEHFEQNLSLGFGYASFNIEENNFYYSTKVWKDWTYGGLFYDFNTHGFFLEVGLTIGSGYWRSPQLYLQIGYVYRFND